MLLLVELSLATYPYIGSDTFCTDVSPIGWNCEGKVGIADYWIAENPDVPQLADLVPAPGVVPGALTADDAATLDDVNTCHSDPHGPPTHRVNDLCGTEAECGAGQALPFGQLSSCTAPPGASTPRSGLIGALEAYGVAAAPPLPDRMPDPGVTVRQATCPYLHTPGWVPWKDQPPTPQQARLDQEDRCFFLACHQCQVVKTLMHSPAGCSDPSISADGDNACEKYWWEQLGAAVASDGGLSAANPPLGTMTKHATAEEKKAFVTFEPLITDFFGSCPMSAPTDRDGKTNFDLGWEYYCSEEPIASAGASGYEPDPAMGPMGLHDGPDAATIVYGGNPFVLTTEPIRQGGPDNWDSMHWNYGFRGKCYRNTSLTHKVMEYNSGSYKIAQASFVDEYVDAGAITLSDTGYAQPPGNMEHIGIFSLSKDRGLVCKPNSVCYWKIKPGQHAQYGQQVVEAGQTWFTPSPSVEPSWFVHLANPVHVTFLLAVLDACVRKLEPADYSLPTTRKPVTKQPDVTKGPDKGPDRQPTRAPEEIKFKLSTEGELQQGEMAFPTWAFGVLVGAVVVLVVAVAALGARLCCARRFASDDYDGGRDSTTDEKGADDTQRV